MAAALPLWETRGEVSWEPPEVRAEPLRIGGWSQLMTGVAAASAAPEQDIEQL